MKKALEAALDALSRRALTLWEIEQRLEGKGYPREEISEAIQRLEEWGYLDDRRLALDYCQVRVRGQSRLRLRQGLRRRGVDQTVINEVLAGVFTEEQELEQCLELARKLFQQENKKATPRSGQQKGGMAVPSPRQKVGAKLLQRGYPMDVVVKALDNFYKQN